MSWGRVRSGWPTRAGTNARSRVWCARPAPRSRRPTWLPSSRPKSPSGRCPSAGASSTRCRKHRSASSTRKCSAPGTRRVGCRLSPSVDAAPAATVVLLRDSERGLEVLLARRSSKLAFHGGAWVFPGGRIDPEDYRDDPDDLEAAAKRAAAREAKEEAGVDVDAETLVHLSNWTTPEISPKRFATW